MLLLPTPALFAHRGASAHAPENTLSAFELALQHGADGIELDTKLTADGVPVVIHDQTVDRTTGATGRVGQLTLKELRALDAGSFFDIAFRGEKIPTLEQVFEAVGQRTIINVELTNYASPKDDLPEKVAALVQKYHLEERILVSSFNPAALRRIHRILPTMLLGLLALPGLPGFFHRSMGSWLTPHGAIHPEKGDVTPGLVASAHRRGRRVHVWTVNDPGDMQRLCSLGVDGFFTDDPRLARKVLHA